MKNACNVALGDWFNPPVIHRVARYGAVVRIWVTDDVRVAGVQVLVLDEEGKIIEKGDATQGRGDWWEYVPSAEGKVIVEARDLAENVMKLEL